jgi:putative NADH-flavin reductase
MTITVFGATGQVGKYVVTQALALGYTVKAFGRSIASLIDKDAANENLIAVKGYVFEEADVLAAVTGVDAVVSVLGGAFDGQDRTRSLGMKNIIAQMKKTGVKRIVALGGMGVLNADEHENELLIEQPDYPEQYKPVGLEHVAAFRSLEASGLDWSFVCSPDILDQPGNRQYITSANYPPKPNQYQIAAGDLADCMLQCIHKKQYLFQRVGISRL